MITEQMAVTEWASNSMVAGLQAANNVLMTAVTTPRPYGSLGDKAFRQWLEVKLTDWAAMGGAHTVQIDDIGNIWALSGSNVLITCHSDTAHYFNKRTGLIQQSVVLRPEPSTSNTMLLLGNGETGCLGADDAAGMALACALVRAGKPYDIVIYVGEERGGVGSSWSAQNEENAYRKYDMAIALDRRGTSDVITHQGGRRTASDVFADALAKRLSGKGLSLKPSDEGIFTDTDVIAHLVPECTNISVGYYNEHTPHETLDLAHFRRLWEALYATELRSLPVSRKPSPYGWDDDSYVSFTPASRGHEEAFEKIAAYGLDAAREYVYNSPEAAAQMLTDLIQYVDMGEESYYYPDDVRFTASQE